MVYTKDKHTSLTLHLANQGNIQLLCKFQYITSFNIKISRPLLAPVYLRIHVSKLSKKKLLDKRNFYRQTKENVIQIRVHAPTGKYINALVYKIHETKSEGILNVITF